MKYAEIKLVIAYRDEDMSREKVQEKIEHELVCMPFILLDISSSDQKMMGTCLDSGDD